MISTENDKLLKVCKALRKSLNFKSMVFLLEKSLEI